MEKRDGLTRRQLLSLSFLALLAPAIRLIPGRCAELAGGAAWLCPLVALPALLLINALAAAFLKNRRGGEGLGAMLLRALGRRVGRPVLGVYALWLTFYAGFLLRSGAERFITTVYPSSGPGVFIAVMLLMALIAALGRSRALGRAAEVFRPLLAITLTLVLGFALLDTDLSRLLPVTKSDVLPVLRGAVPVVDVVSLVLVTIGFLEGLAPTEPGRRRSFALWTALMCLLLTLILAVTLGRFGAELSSRLDHPFFVLVRNTELFGVVERPESVVTALWVFSDFVLVSMALIIGSGAARLALGYPADARQKRPLCLRGGRIFIWLCAAAAGATALVIAPTAFELSRWSQELVPAMSLIVNLGLFGAALAVGKIRGKI